MSIDNVNMTIGARGRGWLKLVSAAPGVPLVR